MENPYAPPGAELLLAPEAVDPGEERLASRGKRLLAAIIDVLILCAVNLPIMYFLGIFDYTALRQKIPFHLSAASSFAAFILYALVNGPLLAKYGQTWGKRAMKIRIVDINGRPLTLTRILLARQLPIQFLSLLPFVGGLIGFADMLAIFGKERRCLHDRVASTKVVDAVQD